MMRHLLALTLALWSTAALAHDARSAAVDVTVAGSVVTVHLAVSQAGLHAALEAAAGHALDARDEGYQALVADHLRRTLRLTADGAPLAVGDIGLRLGDHQSDARFAVELPEGARDLTLTADVLDGVEDHQTLVRIHQSTGTTRGVLSDVDGHTASVALTGASAPVARAAALGAERDGWWAAGLALALGLPLLLVALRRFPATA